MKINVTRRDVLMVAGGTAAGVMLSPLPWKLVDDLAIWTQNWSWIPVPPKGEVTLATSVCTLCPAGCGVEARSIGGLPVSMRGAAADPVSGGALCSLGLTAHHLPYHPSRLTEPVRLARGRTALSRTALTHDAAVDAVARAIAAAHGRGERIAVLDLRPGRSESWAWRRMLASLGGVVIFAPGREGSSAQTLASMLEPRPAALAPDLGSVRTLLSFGAPIAEGWGSPKAIARTFEEGTSKLNLIQVEPLRSATAERADLWISARPGTEAALALGIGHVLLRDGLVTAETKARISDFDAYAATVARFTPEAVSAMSGVEPQVIVATAHRLAQDGPSLVVAGEDPAGGRFSRAAEAAILGLNLLLGNVDQPGGFLTRPELPEPFDSTELAELAELADAADNSIGVLLIDASAGDAAFPWSTVERKLAKGALVVALSPFVAGSATHAAIVVPTPAPLESVREATAPLDAPSATFALAAALLPAREGSRDCGSFVRALATAANIEITETWSSSEELMRSRLARIHATGRGIVTSLADGSTKPASECATPKEMWDALVGGARWTDDPTPNPGARRAAILGTDPAAIRNAGESEGARNHDRPLVIVPRAARDVLASAAVSPVMTKLYQESGLRRDAATAVVNPATARALKLCTGEDALFETACGRVCALVLTDEGVMPGLVALSVGPDATALGTRRFGGERALLEICDANREGVWRTSAARVVEA
jgi:anaerobic selenocysteine-containing dehydrogenase